MTYVNSLKYLLFANEKNESTGARHLVTRNDISLGMLGRFKGKFAHSIYGLIYTASKPVRLQEIYNLLIAVILFSKRYEKKHMIMLYTVKMSKKI